MATQKENFLGRCFTLRSAYGSFRKVSFGPEDLKKLNEFAASNKGWCSIRTHRIAFMIMLDWLGGLQLAVALICKKQFLN